MDPIPSQRRDTQIEAGRRQNDGPRGRHQRQLRRRDQRLSTVRQN